MSDGSAATARGDRRGRPAPDTAHAYAALDLGTNNCRLLIASPLSNGFQVLESFSRIVRLGEGLSRSGRLDERAQDRALAALRVCADKLRRRRVRKVNAVATQACRLALNGADFVQRVEQETGLRLRIISPREEARLAVAGCLNLLDRNDKAAIVVDVGGGSTEVSWVDLRGLSLDLHDRNIHPSRAPIHAWVSLPIGVVTLAEQFPEHADRQLWFRAMVDSVKTQLRAFDHADELKPLFEEGDGHIVGTSGAITSLAGLHLRLPRYDRNRVDGLWMTREDCQAAAGRLIALDAGGRAAEPCIGPERADLVLGGAAILQAIQELWPCERVRVADRGLREGLLMSLMNEGPRPGRRRRGRRRPHGAPSPALA